MKLFYAPLGLRLLFLVIFLSGIALVSTTNAQTALDRVSNKRVFVIKAKLTGYDSCRICCEGFTQTSTGKNPSITDGVAGAPLKVPYFSHVYIADLKENPLRVVDDTGGGMRRYARKLNRIQFDVRFKTHAEAEKFGIRFVNVFVILHNPTPQQIAYFEQESSFSFESASSTLLNAFLEAQAGYRQLLLEDKSS